MKLEDFFEIDAAECIEPSLFDHIDEYYSSSVLALSAGDARLLVDENEMPLAVAWRCDSDWIISSYLYRNITYDIIGKFESCAGEIYQEKRDDYESALREYYCGKITGEYPEVSEDNREGRYEMVTDLFKDTIGVCKGQSAIDFCCGSGVVSKALLSSGYLPLSMDNDPYLLSVGLHKGRLNPTKTLCIDASFSAYFCPESDVGTGLMLGDITGFNSDLWQGIVARMLMLTGKTLITVATEKESVLIRKWCENAGRTPEIFENENDPIYDRWVCLC